MPGESISYLPGMGPIHVDPVLSEEETAVLAAIAEIEAERPLTRSQIALKSMCIALARNIAAGNRKGRAIANEVSTLAATMQLLEGTEDAGDADLLPPDTRKLLDALGTAPRSRPSAPGDTPEP